jgi:hypothetical protein
MREPSAVHRKSIMENIMAKNPTGEFAEQATESARQAGIQGMDWMRALAEQSLHLSKAAFEGYLSTAHRTAENIDRQTAELRERSVSLAAEALANTFDFANRIVRVKKPQEVVALQSEFLSRQAQVLADQAKELGQILLQGANAATRSSAEQMRNAAE